MISMFSIELLQKLVVCKRWTSCDNNIRGNYDQGAFRTDYKRKKCFERVDTKQTYLGPRKTGFHVFATTKSNRRIVQESFILSARRTRIRNVITWCGLTTFWVKRTMRDVVLGSLPTKQLSYINFNLYDGYNARIGQETSDQKKRIVINTKQIT